MWIVGFSFYPFLDGWFNLFSLLGTPINPHVHRLSPLLVRCPLIYPLFAYRKPDAQTTKTASMRLCKGSQLYLRFKKISIFPMDFQNVLVLAGCVCRYASCVSVCLLNIKLKLDWYPNENSGISWILFIFKCFIKSWKLLRVYFVYSICQRVLELFFSGLRWYMHFVSVYLPSPCYLKL